MRILIGIVVVLLGLIGTITYRYLHVKNSAPFARQPSTFTLEPPAGAISGTLLETRGVVEKLARDDKEFRVASPGATILEGESVATKNGSAVATLGNFGTLTLLDTAEIQFANLLPEAILVWQKSGLVRYETNDKSRLSVRALHALAELSGEATITVRFSTVTIQVIRGKVKLGLVDLQNNTNVWYIPEGSSAHIDDETRRVVLR